MNLRKFFHLDIEPDPTPNSLPRELTGIEKMEIEEQLRPVWNAQAKIAAQYGTRLDDYYGYCGSDTPWRQLGF